MKHIKTKSLAVVIMIFACLMAFNPMTAFAHSNENEEDDVIIAPTEEAEAEPMGPLTPSGNMTLVDDYGSTEKGGKQFITVTSKNGNYFYIIIDRDDDGNESVHFLNMVDEADLLNLMDEKEQEKYLESHPTEEEPTEEPTEEATEEPEPEPVKKKGPNVGILILMILAVGGGIFFYMYTKTKGKKSTTTSADPDMDYMETDDEDYIASLNEGADDSEDN